MVIDFFTKETSTSSFIQDVLSSVNNDVIVFDSIENSLYTSKTPFSPIIIWDLDSFTAENERALTALREKSPDSMIFAYADEIGNYGYLCNKFADVSMNTASVRVHLMSKIAKLRKFIEARKIFRERMSLLVGKSPAMEQLRKSVLRAMVNSGPVLIQGETGVGKELIARAVSCIYDKFITVNCSAIPENLFESELFGHTRGAFTGAQNERIGLFEAADGGAIFLDEIGDMPLHAQVKLLRVLQNKEIRPIGANQSKRIDVRIVAATNRNLKTAVKEKKFREDLFYRLNVIPLKISPLRERKEDIEDLVNYFIKQYQSKEDAYTISQSALERLQNHNWPGNIRELENVVQRALCFSNSGELQPEDFQIENEKNSVEESNVISSERTKEQPPTGNFASHGSYDQFRDWQLEQEKQFLIEKIRENNGSVSATAEKLGMLRTALYNRLNRLGVSVKNL
ncbi:MAG: sigma-54-dependent Fis family transcriptional regulator [Fibrobacter sp.]|nr:sigma-54-dependent Fis family transcriptional regulator [Fibrobacter sp.]